MRLLTILILFAAVQLPAQDTLSLPEALAVALEQNYGIKMAKNDAEIAHLNNTRANAGLLPVVSLNAGDNASAVNFRQKLANGTEIERPLGFFNTFFTSVNASWTVFDGRRAYMEKERLDALDFQSKEILRAQVEQTTTSVALAWYEVGRRQETIRNLDEVITTLRERLTLASNRLEFGIGNKSDVLLAQIDLNDRLRQKTLAENDLAEAKRTLNGLLVRDPETVFTTSAMPVNLPLAPDKEALKNQLLAENPTVDALEAALKVAQLVAAQAKTLNKPRIGLSGAYNFQRSDNTTGFSLFTMQHGPSFGVNFSMPLYTGGNNKRQEETAKIAVQSAEMRITQLQQDLLVQMHNLISRMATLRQAMEVDIQTLAYARENVLIATERFRLGQSTALEIREAQLSLENALFRINQTRFDLWVTDVMIQAL